MQRLLFLLIVITAVTLNAQPGVGADQVISVDVNLVVLHVSVSDQRAGSVSGLQQENFRVFEDRKPQNVRVFQHDDVPVAIGLVVDNSGSMGRKRTDVTAAALAFVRTSNAQDQMFVVNFNEHVSLGLPNTRLFSASPAELEGALNGVPASGMTALYDAVQVALDRVKAASLDKKVLIVISDGADNASSHSLAQVMEAARRSDVVIYTVGLFDEYSDDANPGILKKLAHETGGETFLPAKTSEVVEICEGIAKDIRSQYTIGYVPTNTNLDNTYRSIRVTVVGTRGGKFEVRTKPGYFAAPKAASGARDRGEK